MGKPSKGKPACRLVECLSHICRLRIHPSIELFIRPPPASLAGPSPGRAIGPDSRSRSASSSPGRPIRPAGGFVLMLKLSLNWHFHLARPARATCCRQCSFCRSRAPKEASGRKSEQSRGCSLAAICLRRPAPVEVFISNRSMPSPGRPLVARRWNRSRSGGWPAGCRWSND